MNGVMTPGVSAGSNHVGASDTWMAKVIWPSGGADAAARPAAGGTTIRTRASARNCQERWSVTLSSILSGASLADGQPTVSCRGSIHQPAPAAIIRPEFRARGECHAESHAEPDAPHGHHRFVPATDLVHGEPARPLVARKRVV